MTTPASEGEKIVNAARRALGLPYIWGGGNAAGPTGGASTARGWSNTALPKPPTAN
ncbi:hypothetical protein I553_10769 [Mycobacterium xenopi 4042]|uniref:Uncharacterized protein n=1 Tax=Mycobacterium xenopi 4042 TaxID=1299334 RepID=X8DA16_MYCXE|nr:hypothetical protein I553_10769 [Mycobacterium xenopi 4042]